MQNRSVVGAAFEVATRDPDTGPPLSERVNIIQEARGSSAEVSRELDVALLGHCLSLRTGLVEATENLARAQEIINQFTAMPLYPATFLQYEQTSAGQSALVSVNNALRVVALSEDAAALSLVCGDEVYLGSEQTVIVDMIASPRRGGEIVEFDRLMPDGRLILKGRGEEQIIAEPAGSLDVANLLPGDPIRLDRPARIARERLDGAPPRTEFALSEVPDLPLCTIAGDATNLNRVMRALQACLFGDEISKLYGLNEHNNSASILLHGPPGCGKTLISQVACAEIARRADRKAYFVVVPASGLEAPYVGQTQSNIRAAFSSLREAAKRGPAVLFIDEIEAIGRVRGGSVGHHSDKFLSTLLTELDGFSRRSGVAVIAATNRKDMLDPALLDRLGLQIPVRRPNLSSARSILAANLPQSLPYHPNGASASDTRSDIVSTAVTRLYAPNAGNEIGTLKFSDGRTRTVFAHELVSGRLLKQVCNSARDTAAQRHAEGGTRGIQLSDIESAVATALDQLASSLSPQSAHHHLADLTPEDIVVSVATHTARVPNRSRYLRVPEGV